VTITRLVSECGEDKLKPTHHREICSRLEDMPIPVFRKWQSKMMHVNKNCVIYSILNGIQTMRVTESTLGSKQLLMGLRIESRLR
jgi:hypothetical protein